MGGVARPIDHIISHATKKHKLDLWYASDSFLKATKRRRRSSRSTAHRKWIVNYMNFLDRGSLLLGLLPEQPELAPIFLNGIRNSRGENFRGSSGEAPESQSSNGGGRGGVICFWQVMGPPYLCQRDHSEDRPHLQECPSSPFRD